MFLPKECLTKQDLSPITFIMEVDGEALQTGSVCCAIN